MRPETIQALLSRHLERERGTNFQHPEVDLQTQDVVELGEQPHGLRFDADAIIDA